MKKIYFLYLVPLFVLLLLTGLHLNAQTSKVQFINNSPDVLNDTVQVRIYNTITHDSMILDKFAFRTSKVITLDSGYYQIYLAKRGSKDSTGSKILIRMVNYRIDTSKGYLAIISGVNDTASFRTNPDGINRTVSMDFYDTYNFIAPNNTLNVFYVNGVPDAGAISLDTFKVSAVNIFAAADYHSAPAMINLKMNAVNKPYVIFQKSGGIHTRTFLLDMNGFSKKSCVIFSSGLNDTTNCPKGSQLSDYYLAYSDGSVVKERSIYGYLQMVHGSADSTLAHLAFFVDGKNKPDLYFRHATPYLPFAAFRSYRIHISIPPNDTNTNIFSTTYYADSNAWTYGITTGLSSPADFAVNPDGVDCHFSVIMNAARPAAIQSKNVDLLYFHSMTDAPATTAIGKGQLQYLSKNNKYKAFNSGYRSHTGLDDVDFDFMDAAQDILLFTYSGSFSSRKGFAGVAVSTGFLHAHSNGKVYGDTPLIIIAWPDGDIDSIGPSTKTGIGSSFIMNDHFTCYPNPAISELKVNFESTIGMAVNVFVLDIAGKELMKQEFTAIRGKNEMNLPVSNLPAGLYFLKLQNENQSVTGKFIISR